MKLSGNYSNPLVLISSNYKSMTNSEQKVADYIHEHMHEVVHLTVADLAEKIGVGESTVLRFCRKLSYRGYQQFKLSIAQSLVSADELVVREVIEGDSLEVIARKITQQHTKTLNDSLELLSIDQIKKSIAAIVQARSIHFFGFGSSAITAQDAERRFMRMGFNVYHTSDPYVMAMRASLITEQDVVIGISKSGSTKDVVDAMRIAKKNKAHVICITNHARSPITHYANEILLAAANESLVQEDTYAPNITQLQLLDILTHAMALEKEGIQ